MSGLISTYNKIKAIPLSVLIKKFLKTPFSGISENRVERKFKTKLQQSDDIKINENFESIFIELFPAKDNLKQYKNKLSEFCSKIINHEFDILGSGPIVVRNENPDYEFFNIYDADKDYISLIPRYYSMINWQEDIKSGYQWDIRTASKDIIYGSISGVDIKVPWELGRLQYLIPLIYCAIIDDDSEKYIKEYSNQLIDFIISNPISYGVQWKSSMDAAIRAINILMSYSILKINQIRLDEIFENALKRTLYEHMIFIYYHLEWNDGLRGNHYLFGLCGLIVLSSIFNDYLSQQIKLFAIKKFLNETNYQFNNDGGNFEASTHYHLFTSEAVLLVKFILEKEKIKSENFLEFYEKVKAINNFSNSILSVSDEKIHIGDNDGGYLLKLHPEDILRINAKSYSHIRRLITCKSPDSKVIRFDDFGLYILKKENYSIIFRCGDVGQKGKGGHSHNDQLSFVLSVKGNNFFVDPGTYCYTPNRELRNKYRSSAYHNIFVVTGKGQNRFTGSTSDDLFWLPDSSHAKLLGISHEIIEAEHMGYGMPHRRKFYAMENQLIVEDYCKLEGSIHFHLHPDVEINYQPRSGCILKRGNVALQLNSKDSAIEIEGYDYSPDYGEIITSKKLIVRKKSAEATTTIQLINLQ